jgi:hypothetical protein
MGASVVIRKPLTFRAPASLVAPAASDAIFAPSASPTCPPGQHWEDDNAPTVLKGLGACVPDVVTVQPLTLRPAAPSTAASAPAPAPAAPVVTETCPPLWPWWWLVLAAGAGGALGYYVQKNQKKVKRNAGRIAGQAAGRIVNRASEAALARLVG